MARLRLVTSTVCALALFLLALPRVEIAQAATFNVTTTQDAAHTTPVDGNCTSTIGQCTLRAAVQAANFLGGAHTINLPAGTYRLTVTGADEDSAASGDLDLSANITIVGAGGGSTVVDGNATDRVFDVASSSTVSLSGLTVQNGNPLAGQAGGGIANQGALTLSNAIVSGSTAAFGGGILNSAGATLTLTNVGIGSNTASVSGAGLTNNGVATATGLVVTANSATNQGGGILNANQGNLTLTNSTINSNNTTAGTSASPSAGAGILNTNQSSLTLTGVTINGNIASTAVTNSFGGGLYTFQSTSTLTNVTVSGNVATTGGGLYVLNGAAPLTNVTLNFNSATNGGGIFNSGNTTLRNTIVANSTGANCGGVSALPVTSLGNNLDSGSSCGLAAAGDQPSTAPQLGPLQNNGGPTLTHALLPGSPAVDAVLSGCPPPATDQRGVIRPKAVRCDIGAFELGGTPPVTATTTLTPTVTATVTATPTPPPSCTPRPNVGVAVARSGAGRLQATITATSGPGAPNNQLVTLQFGNATNALIDLPTGQTGLTGNFSFTVAPGTTTTTFFIRQANTGQAATVPLTVNDLCGGWPTFGGGGVSAFSGTSDPATPAPTATRAAAPAAASTPTPPPTAVCTPRPPVRVSTAPGGDGRLQVTVAADAGARATLVALRFGAATNAAIDAGDQVGLSGGFAVTLPAGTRETTFTVRRATAGQATTVPLTVVDSCGEWPTVLGGGAAAF